MSSATLDQISEGRFMLGIGTSGQRVIEGFHAREFKKPLSELRDVIRVVKTLLGGRRLTDAGSKLHDYRPFQLAFEPLRPTIPIYVAALKENSITSIGELADGWIPTFWPYDKLDVGLAWARKGAEKAGRDPSEISCAPFTTVIPMGSEAGTAQAKQILAFYIGGMGDYYKELLSGFGYAEECRKIADLYADKATRSKSADAVTTAMIEALSITGDPAHCVQELERRRSFGIDLPILNLPSGLPFEVVEMFIRGMAPTA
jgi:alkanesulfonate monooxygenase SsuD/methylene tetrahydromethanopterin reductase-like flavin-dependent oxidoreductase (luciferase family)